MFKVAKLFISIFRESDSLKELIKEEKFEKVIDHCSELIKSTEDRGQLISKCPFAVIVWTKIPTKNLTNFALEFEKW